MPRAGLIDFTAIRQSVSFADILTHYDLSPEKPGSKQVKIHCPFHEDRTPSCSINIEKGIFNCFGCPAEGNVLDFIAHMEGFTDNPTYNAALKAVEIAGIDIATFKKDGPGAASPQKPRRAAQTAKPARNTPRGQKMPQRAVQPVSDDAKQDAPSTENPVINVSLDLNPQHPFLAERDIDPELATEFGIGYCAKGIMRHRIAIPIHNSNGELVAYCGRYAGDPVPDGVPRYKLPKQFHKSLELFNLHRAMEFDKRYVVIVEGIWSVLRLHALGIPAVALLGTSASAEQAALLRAGDLRYATVILDGDEAGRAAAPAVIQTLSQHVYVRSLELPEGVKPDTMDDTFLNRLVR